MNVYFACSITGGRQDESVYQAIVDSLLEAGHTIPTAGLSLPEILLDEQVIEPQVVYRRDTAWIDACDALIAEVSTPSHGVGYEIGYALSRGKLVLCCCREGQRLSKMISGNPDSRLVVRWYKTPDEAVRLVDEFVSALDHQGME